MISFQTIARYRVEYVDLGKLCYVCCCLQIEDIMILIKQKPVSLLILIIK